MSKNAQTETGLQQVLFQTNRWQTSHRDKVLLKRARQNCLEMHGAQ
jgi:hypothetical protein